MNGYLCVCVCVCVQDRVGWEFRVRTDCSIKQPPFLPLPPPPPFLPPHIHTWSLISRRLSSSYRTLYSEMISTSLAASLSSSATGTLTPPPTPMPPAPESEEVGGGGAEPPGTVAGMMFPWASLRGLPGPACGHLD